MKQDMNWNQLLWRCVDNNAYQGCDLPEREEYVEEPFNQEGSNNAPQYSADDAWNSSGEIINGGAKEKDEWSDGWNNNGGGSKEKEEWSDGWNNDGGGTKEKEEWSDGWNNDVVSTKEKEESSDGWNNDFVRTKEKEECSVGGEEMKNGGDLVAEKEDEWSDGWK